MLRLIAYTTDGARRFPVHRDSLLIGSSESCDIVLPYTGVAKQHARLRSTNGDLEIEDLGSRRGVLVNGRRVKRSCLAVLDEVRLGAITLLVEEAAPPDLPADTAESEPRRALSIDARSFLGHLARVSDWVLGDSESNVPLESLIRDLLEDLGGGAMFLYLGELDNPVIKFSLASESRWTAAGQSLLEQVREHLANADPGRHEGRIAGRLGKRPATLYYSFRDVLERPYLLVGAFSRLDEAALGWSPVRALSALATLLVIGLVHHLGRYEPILPGGRGRAELNLAPGLIVGESAAMHETMTRLRAALETDGAILLRGEKGSGKELVARTLHLSGRQASGPFVVATASGATYEQLAAEIFGAEVAGKSGPIRRPGKLAAADGGTFFLDDIEGLDLGMQARLVRFLRTGELEPIGGLEPRRVDVRLVAGCAAPLDALLARGDFRIDLGYRLGTFTIEVPPLRQRREDLPLLIQSLVNRFCHEADKRVQGVTVQAMTALLAYDYPGNLAELENIARQMVLLCPSGQPIDVGLLPDPVKLGKIREAAAVDAESELDLGRLTAGAERAAIREALRRTDGNKSQAARLLGLSRNGLAMKMQRYGLAS